MGRIQSYKTYTVKTGATGYDIETINNTASGLSAIPVGINAATMTITAHADTVGDAIYVTLNGETPSASVGLALRDGSIMEIFEGELQNAKFVSADASNSQTIRIEYATVS